MSTTNGNLEGLLDPSLLEGLSEEQRQEALDAAAAAKRAEERAEQRALERAMRRKEEERKQQQEGMTTVATSQKMNGDNKQSNGGLVYIPKRRRLQQDAQPPQDTTTDPTTNNHSNNSNHHHHHPEARKPPPDRASQPPFAHNNHHNNNNPAWSRRELEAVKESYLGKSAAEIEQERTQQRKKQRKDKKTTFKFKWDETDDTTNHDDPLYSSLSRPGAGNRKHQYRNNHSHHNNHNSNDKRHTLKRRLRLMDDSTNDHASTVDSVLRKPLSKMTARDWRIFRENYEIVVKGGRAPPPLRSFREPSSAELPPLHPALLEALEQVLKFREPTPIQRQSIPIGLQRRDLIGIAETGSGKTVAFGVPLCNYLLSLPSRILNRVAEEGPLAIVMAPTRELALQIDGELSKLLARQSHITNCAIIGGQQLQHQAAALRRGVHIVIGTPGRINECLEMAYLVLNQCCYIVLDEADRMVDMGFAPQMESILDAMGGLLKSESEQETYQQELEDLERSKDDLPLHRVTAMFSATMPLQVERIAKRYLRHPAVISIGDRDSGKNARIEQRVIFLSAPSLKEKALRDVLSRSNRRDEKIIVFVNEKKHADGVGRIVERMGRSVVVLHGGKSQEQREENLGIFRRGGVVLVATDVAGRGLDISDVSHVINYDLPTRSIENYCHRIGRTGRAGKEGLATSFITDEDEGIMAPLKAYLESTRSQIPERLARHPAAKGNAQENFTL